MQGFPATCNRVPELQVLCEPIFPVPHCPGHHQIDNWNRLTFSEEDRVLQHCAWDPPGKEA